jgi:glutamate--cysteine ligase
MCRIGTEHEKFGFQLNNLQPMSYEQIRQLLEGLAERFEWQKVMEGDNIIGLTFVSSHFPILES